MTELDAEDGTLIVLARAALARTGGRRGAAVRDTDGRTYAAADVTLPSLTLSALQAAVAVAVSSGATAFEAAAVVGESPGDAAPGTDAGVTALHDVSPDTYIVFAAVDGTVQTIRTNQE
ncbi:cytidine deaminase [Rhodococcus triatomae]|uniref:Cytidine deaminase n=1 Tax=Rhodococcus triatomae TaxID=300028 RepID=A0A1G8DJ12_9NOCA|nr:cytidine deaminase [Rhodococcus triatomae]QNG18417.1 cytidine deaminase [Rhodococcus triatomae]QNG21913.1 cytidine deaminase [Rhodococcus triatomae]SDH57678.1 hypothetical protein SAMN05444695_102320 [Rhodococcus triatomae]